MGVFKSFGTKSYEYNELNLHKKLTNARGQVRQFFYDAMGRITGLTTPEGAVSYTYDANGNVLTVTDSTGTTTRTYDALNRVTSCTDTYGKVIQYEYDAVGNLTKLIYPDNTAVTYAYDTNHNLIRVTDWANRVTTYTYDVNNRVIGVTKPDGSVTTTVYDNKQRVVSSVEKTASGAVISGFEYTYDDLSRIICEKVLANSTQMCYTYDDLSRVTKRTLKTLSNTVLSEENYTYDAAGNVIDAPDSCFQYDTNNRLVVFNGNNVTYDLDGNMLNDGVCAYTYDSANRLKSFGGHTYTYTSADIRIRNLCAEEDTTYTYDTNCKLSQLLTKTTNGVTTKYVYGRGLIGEEVNNAFKTYHFDFRGSTVAITNQSGNITDTFVYDTYGNLASRTGTSKVIFLYNGCDGVITDDNGLYYMRARYYSPEMRRFVNADIVPGQISNAVTLNRFAYANGNPVSFVDPFGLSADERSDLKNHNYTMAFYVTDTSLDLVGHSELYFYDLDGYWYSTEFNSTNNSNLFIQKDNAIVQRAYKENEFFDAIGDPSNFKFGMSGSVTVHGYEHKYVVLTGNFNDCVALASEYEDQQIKNYYNLPFNNCSDYTDKILNKADVDGAFTQSLLGTTNAVSIPIAVQENLRTTTQIDNSLGTNNGFINEVGDFIGDVQEIISLPIVATKSMGERTTRFVWSVIKYVHEGVKKILD